MNMNIKRRLFLWLIAALMLLTAACSGANNGQQSNQANTQNEPEAVEVSTENDQSPPAEEGTPEDQEPLPTEEPTATDVPEEPTPTEETEAAPDCEDIPFAYSIDNIEAGGYAFTVTGTDIAEEFTQTFDAEMYSFIEQSDLYQINLEGMPEFNVMTVNIFLPKDLASCAAALNPYDRYADPPKVLVWLDKTSYKANEGYVLFQLNEDGTLSGVFSLTASPTSDPENILAVEGVISGLPIPIEE